MNDFQNNFKDYILSGHSMLSIRTHEKERAIDQIRESTERCVYIWSIINGWQDDNKPLNAENPATTPQAAIQQLSMIEDNSVCILKDFGTYVDHKIYNEFDIVIAWLDEYKQIVSNIGQTIIFLGPDFEIPNILKHDITEMDFNLPDQKDIENQIKFVCESVVTSDGKKIEPNKDTLNEIIKACRGMTQQETIDRVSLALRKNKDLNKNAIKTILHEKANVIKSSGLLTYIEPTKGGLDVVGGYDALKDHIKLDGPCFSEEAKKFGIEFPKGILLVGIPGCGKTLLSIAIASEFGLPLISMDVGNLMSKYVGDSESNMRQAIKILESIAPCVLQLDEIEKGFGGGDLDGGASQRVFGTFLKWLNDKTSPIYIVATANNIQSLPPEFGRKGRFDEIFGLDLPSTKEREMIFQIHSDKRGYVFNNKHIKEFAKATEGFTGADIEQTIKLGLKIAFSNGKQFNESNVHKAITEIIPLSKSEPNRIEAIREWCKLRAKQANPTEQKKSNKKRKVTI